MIIILSKMSVLRQVAVHQVAQTGGLPREMADEIMGFCFYDTITAVYRAVHKANLLEVIEHFDDAYVSRARPFGPALVADPDNAEHWSVCLSRVTNLMGDNEVQFQAWNCGVCGNYYFCQTFLPDGERIFGQGFDHEFLQAIPIVMRCSCNRQ